MLSDNGRFGLWITPDLAAKSITGVIQRLTANNNRFGIDIDLGAVNNATGNFSISDSVFSNSLQSGVYGFQSSSVINIAIDNNKFIGNGFVMDGYGIDYQSINKLTTFGQNYFFNNRVDTSGAPPAKGTVM